MKQHVQLPNSLIKLETINPKDLLVYLSIKRCQNKNTQTSIVSLDTLMRYTGASKVTVTKCIKKLIDAGYISRKKTKKCYEYSFLKYKYFECFSYDFLDNPKLSFIEKAYIAANQQFMIKDENTQTGKTTYPNSELSNKIHMSERTIKRCDNSLKAKEYLNILTTRSRNEAGFYKTEKIFHLGEIGQSFLFILKSHDDDIQSLKEDTAQLKNNIYNQNKVIEEIREKFEQEKKDIYSKCCDILNRKTQQINSLQKDNNILRRDNSQQAKLIKDLKSENVFLKSDKKISLDEEGNKTYKL